MLFKKILYLGDTEDKGFPKAKRIKLSIKFFNNNLIESC